MKQDGSTAGQVHTVNLCRECVAPGTQVPFRLTLDQSILKNRITMQSILSAINAFAAYYRRTYESHFARPYGTLDPGLEILLYLGGGFRIFCEEFGLSISERKTGT